jgi:hypothetical protein
MGGALLTAKKIEAQPKITSRDSEVNNRTGGPDSLGDEHDTKKKKSGQRRPRSGK